jgi:hypothetical protein
MIHELGVSIVSHIWESILDPILHSGIRSVCRVYDVAISIYLILSAWFVTRLTQRLPLLEQELLTLPGAPEFTPDF